MRCWDSHEKVPKETKVNKMNRNPSHKKKREEKQELSYISDTYVSSSEEEVSSDEEVSSEDNDSSEEETRTGESFLEKWERIGHTPEDWSKMWL